LLVTLTTLPSFKQANAQRGSSYVLPPSAPSNTIVNPFYFPRTNIPGGDTPQQDFLVRSLYSKASDARWAGDYTTEFQLYNKIISLDSQEAQAYFNRGSIKQSKLNNRAGTMADFRIAFELFQQKGDKYMTRASMEHI
jgi:tetratricopeptide (TPR) repeat protein